MIRKARLEDAEAIAKVHVESWRSAYRNVVDDDFLDTLKWEDRLARWQKLIEVSSDSAIFVATRDNQVVGFLSGGKIREPTLPYDGELYAIYVHPHFQRQGVGEELFAAFAAWAKENNLHALLVWVAEKSPYKQFYSKMHGELTPYSQFHKIGNREIKVIAYGWKL